MMEAPRTMDPRASLGELSETETFGHELTHSRKFG